MSTLISGSIDLTKIDKSKLKDGKYLQVQISVNDTTDNYGNNVSITVNQTKEEREAKEKKTYLGNAKVVWPDNVIKLAEKVDAPSAKVENDLVLEHFTIEDDKDDMIPMILEAKAISKNGFKIIASPWSCPPCPESK